ncbi:MAG: TonB family protein [Pseudomonadota bacterium]
MAATFNLRATSFGVSALLMGAALFAALTMTTQIVFHPEDPIGEIDVHSYVEPPVPPPPTTTEKPIVRTLPDPRPDPIAQHIDPIPDAPPTTSGLVTTADLGPVEITAPRWTQRPSNLQRYYPRRAADRNIEGAVMLDCLVGTTGALSCNVISETPSGWGFSEAALRMSRDYAMVPAMRNGAPTQGRYRMRVPFSLR